MTADHGPERPAQRGQVTLGTLTVFLSMVLVAAIAAMVLLNTAGVLQTKAAMTAQQSERQVTGQVQALEVVGLKTPADGKGEIGAVTLLVARGPGAGDLNLTRLTMQWVDDTGTYHLAHEEVVSSETVAVDGEFTHTPIKDDDDSLVGRQAVLDDRGDRAKLVVDVGDPETTGDLGESFDTVTAATPVRRAEGGLEPGETAMLRLTTGAGTATTVRLVVPKSISGGTAARL